MEHGGYTASGGLEMRTVYQLTRDELQELKINYYSRDRDISYQEMVDIDELVSDQEIQEAYRSTRFVDDDFCNAFEW